jgi:Zn-dependent peptidase ImmA (M78 family)
MSQPTPEQEIEATIFAMCLLMPAELLTVQWYNSEIVDQVRRIHALAKLFEVDVVLMTARLIELELFLPWLKKAEN